MERISGIYKITNCITNQFYIGSSKNIFLRWRDHKKPSTIKRYKNQKLYKDFIEYGIKNFLFEIIERTIPENLKNTEKYYIAKLNPYYNIQKTPIGNNYKQGTCGIYKISNKITNDTYIGSSSNIEMRWKSHRCKSNYEKYPNSLLYQNMQKYGNENFNFTILEQCSKDVLFEREQYYIDLLRPSLNVAVAKAKMSSSEYKRGYFIEHKESIQAKKKTWRDNNKDWESKRNHLYYSRKCKYENEILTLNALRDRFKKLGILNPTSEAKKYLIE